MEGEAEMKRMYHQPEATQTAATVEERMMDRRILANAIRALSMDAVERANSGHPGAPMGMADMAEVLWNDFVRHNPKNPRWSNRDRVVLSNGHASMLLYSVLHLSGYDLTIDDIKNFRQLHSRTPGHPEYGHTPGVETTTGPLGQGITMAVGMALAEKLLASEFNREGFPIVDHYTYVLVGDGCLMEGISHEAASLAGTWKLGKLIVLYDDNGISIDGEVKGWFTEDVAARFRSYGWQVIAGVDGHDASAVAEAIRTARADTGHPSLICCKTVIGYGSPKKAGKESVHGAPLGKEEVEATRDALGWNYEPFVIPEEVYRAWNAVARGQEAESQWNSLFDRYEAAYPELASEFKRRGEGKLPENFDQVLKAFLAQEQPKKEATRKTSQRVLSAFKEVLPEMIGGSADLTHSNLTNWPGMQPVQPGANGGNYLHFGVREFAMAAILNGLQLHGHYRPFGGTFLIFSDYMRNAMRLSALMKLPVIYVLTHDSIGLGEDGPTHQPVEQLPSLRLIPDMEVWRPANVEETLVAWSEALRRKDGPTALILSRSNFEFYPADDLSAIAKGACVVLEPSRKAEQLILATGSELPLAMEAAKQKNARGGAVRVVSMPCVERFERQDAEYQEWILSVPYAQRYVVEAAHPALWAKYAPLANVIGVNSFGASAPGDILMRHFGFRVERLLEKLGA
jgi:transketolase